MHASTLPDDPLWPRAARLFTRADGDVPACDVALLGVPAHLTSISPTGADATPGAVRESLMRYSTWSTAHAVDLGALTAVDLGDVEDPDGAEGEARVAVAVARARAARLLIAIGGDNSITHSVARGRMPDLAQAGLVTIDIHHDLRDGETNGSPVRRLIEAGLPGDRIVQIGIADFSNSPAHAARARDLGITVVPMAELSACGAEAVAADALRITAADSGPVYVDVDVDVCDRAFAPACPASAPGGMSAGDLRRLVSALARSPRVTAVDIVEVDATRDAPDQRTVRLAALLVLEAAAGVALRGPASEDLRR